MKSVMIGLKCKENYYLALFITCVQLPPPPLPLHTPPGKLSASRYPTKKRFGLVFPVPFLHLPPPTLPPLPLPKTQNRTVDLIAPGGCERGKFTWP